MIRAVKPLRYFEFEHIVEFEGGKLNERCRYVQDEVLAWCVENGITDTRIVFGESLIFPVAADADLCYLRFA
jgi:hypothetical protein